MIASGVRLGVAAALVAGLVGLWAGQVSAAAGQSKVVVELFTSEGCSSCPPAESLLGEIARRDDVVALAFHIDYWNYLGWKDKFSKPRFTARQKAYGKTLKRRYIYTPQIVVDGRAETVGSRRGEVERLIAAARARSRLDIAITHPDDTTALITIPKADYDGPPAIVWTAFYDAVQTVDVLSGENGGRRLVHTNVVRILRQVGTWDGSRIELRLPLDGADIRGRDGCAIIVQAGIGGPILGAATLPLPGRGG
jgi:hypothetical protein